MWISIKYTKVLYSIWFCFEGLGEEFVRKTNDYL